MSAIVFCGRPSLSVKIFSAGSPDQRTSRSSTDARAIAPVTAVALVLWEGRGRASEVLDTALRKRPNIRGVLEGTKSFPVPADSLITTKRMNAQSNSLGGPKHG